MGYWQNKLEKYKDLKKVARESIKFQERGKLERLAEKVGVFRLTNVDVLSYSGSEIADQIKDDFNTSIKLVDGREFGVHQQIFAGVFPPQLDKNHPLIPELQRLEYNGNRDLSVYSKFAKDNIIIGEVNGEEAKLGDMYAKIVCTMVISPALFKDTRFTDLEIAAIILHEVGHIYTYFKLLGRTLVTNMILDAATNRLMGLAGEKEKMKVVSDTEKLLQTRIEMPETVLSSDKKDVVYLHLVSEVIRERMSGTGSKGYANRTWERLADDFATRCGAGPHLATALYKMESSKSFVFKETAYRGMVGHVIVEALRLSLFVPGTLVGALLSAGVFAICLSFTDPSKDIYDKPEERFRSIRRTMTDELKTIEGLNNKAANDRRREILNDIAVIDSILSDVKDKLNIFGLVHNFVLPQGRRERNLIQLQQDIEQYMMSDLNIASAKLKNAANA